MEARSLGALAAILIAVVFSIYIIAGGITGLFVAPPDKGEPAETPETPEAPETAGGPEALTEEPQATGEGGAPEEGLCRDVSCTQSRTTCPDHEVITCENTCDPLTGQCLNCTPDCSDHQIYTGGGGGSPPSGGSPPCTDTIWTPQEWSECSLEGDQTRTLISNCGSTRIEAQDCTAVWLSPASWQAGLGQDITLDVEISTPEDVYAFDFRLYFNKSLLNALDFQEGNFLNQDGATTSQPTTNGINEAEGYVWFALARFGSQAGVSGQGTLAVLTFHSTGQGESPLNIQHIEIINSSIQSIDVSAHNGTIEIA